MIRLALAVGLLLGGFVAGLAAMLAVLDRLFGGQGPRIELDHPDRAAAEFGASLDGPLWPAYWQLDAPPVLTIPPRSHAEVAADRQLLLERLRREGMGE